jgi:D-serine deaminase-like pyridoxal phosphate-dependent protein
VLIAYPLVGPNLGRLAELIRKFPGTTFSTLIDHPDATRALSAAMSAAGLKVGVVMDLDVGQHRTGIPVGDGALALYKLAASLPGLVPNGFQLYDGHNNKPERDVREAAVRQFIAPVLQLRAQAEAAGLPVPRLVCGGTPSFPVYARMTDVPGIECSPGTFVLHDAGYGPKYADLSGITPAAVLVTRVISRPTPDRVTLDLGNKAVAADPVLEKRVTLLDFPEYKTVGHNEEHLIVETAGAERYKPGDVVYALPGHICPTVALHKEVLVAEGGKVVGRWAVASRDRVLTV